MRAAHQTKTSPHPTTLDTNGSFYRQKLSGTPLLLSDDALHPHDRGACVSPQRLSDRSEDGQAAAQ